MVAQLVAVVEILLALGDANDRLGDEATQGVANPLGVAVIGEAVGYLVRKRQVPIHLAQQQGAGIGSDGAAVESGHHAAAAVGFKLQGFGVTLCRHRFESAGEREPAQGDELRADAGAGAATEGRDR